MRLRSILFYSVATAAVALISPAPTPILTLPSTAQAANVSVSIGTFYDDLAPYGDWVSFHNNYVFVPANLPGHWRPYTVGHWVHTERYGWLWVSAEPFGWATYHYGRWGYDPDIGWFWIPGRRWAPAWVSWRRSAGHFVWAPLPPGPDYGVDVEVAVEDIPDDYWVVVPSRDFLDTDLSVVVIADDSERVRFVREAEPIGDVVVENNIVVNNVININEVEKETQQKVKTVAVKDTTDPKLVGKAAGGGQVSVFRGEVKQEEGAKPKKIEDVEAVKTKQAQKKEGQPTQPKGTEQPGQTEQGQAQPGQEQPLKKKGKATTEQPGQTEQGQAQPGQEQPLKKKKGKAATEQPGQAEQAQPEQGQEQPIKKKKGKATAQPGQPEEVQPQQGAEQSVKKKKKPPQSQGMQQGEPQMQGGEEPVKKKKRPAQSEEMQQGQPQMQGEQPSKKSKKGACDPSTGEGCQ